MREFNGRLAFAVACAALGTSFQHGYNTAVIYSSAGLVQPWTELVQMVGEDRWLGTMQLVLNVYPTVVFIFCVGGIMGSSITGFVAKMFGRRGGLLLNTLLVILAAILEGTAKTADSYKLLIAGRFFIGVNSGLGSGLTLLYLAEISPVHFRGAVGTMYQLGLSISILICQALSLEQVLGTHDRWPFLFAVTVIPAIFQLCMLPMCPESPTFLLLENGRQLEARRALRWLRGRSRVQDEMNEMKSEYEASKLVPNPSSMYSAPLFISLGIMVAQQFTCINVVMFFSTNILLLARSSGSVVQYANLVIYSLNVLMTLTSLVLVDKVGRRTLLLIGFTGMFFDTILLAICLSFEDKVWFLPIFSILLVFIFVIMFAIGPGSIPWFLVTELFDQSARPAATSLAVCVNWTANFIVGIGFSTFGVLFDDAKMFCIIAAFLGIATIFVYIQVPETKNKTREEINAMFRQES